MKDRIDLLIDEQLQVQDAEFILEKRVKPSEINDEVPRELLVGLKKEVELLYRALLDSGIRARYTYSNTPRKTVFTFGSDDKGAKIRKAYAIAQSLKINCTIR